MRTRAGKERGVSREGWRKGEEVVWRDVWRCSEEMRNKAKVRKVGLEWEREEFFKRRGWRIEEVEKRRGEEDD